MTRNQFPIRVLIVDDSAFIRNIFSMMLMKFPDVQVVGTAQNGMEAIEQVKRSRPDVMTLDVDMPGMNGLDVLDYVMTHHPLPVIMISALTHEGAGMTLQALERGAVDFIPKDGCSKHFASNSFEDRLHDKVQEAYQARLGVPLSRHGVVKPISFISASHHQTEEKERTSNQWPGVPRGVKRSAMPPARDIFPIVVIGSSTGGPNLMKQLVNNLPVPFAACLIIIQHMPKYFTKVFSENLNAVASLPIREACNGDVLEPGVGLVAPGDQHLFIDRPANGRGVIKISTESAHLPYRPSVDSAMASAAEHFGSSVIGVVVSGMGNDGVVGCQKIKEHGGTVLVQNEATALMYGMPRAVVEAGLADAVISSGQLAECIVQNVETLCEKAWTTPGGHPPVKGQTGSG